MNTQLLQLVEQAYYKNDEKAFEIGDVVKVHNVIRDGDKSRIQMFQGLVIAKKHSGARTTFTVRKISAGIGVEKIFPLHSPNVAKIEVMKRGKVRRAKLYYLRERVGKAALKVKAGAELSPADSLAVDMGETVETIKTDETSQTAETVAEVESVVTQEVKVKTTNAVSDKPNEGGVEPKDPNPSSDTQAGDLANNA